MRARLAALFALVAMLAPNAAFAGTLDPALAALLHPQVVIARAQRGNTALPLIPTTPRLDHAGRVQVYVHLKAGVDAQALAATIAGMGASGITAAPLLHVVQAWIPVNSLPAVAALGDVRRVSVPEYARVPSRAALASAVGATVPAGLAIDSDAPAAMQALVLNANGASGAGVKVGVISGDIAGLAASQAAGYLPAAVWTDPNYPGTTPVPGNPGEGTALLEIVHAMAPEATLGFCAPVTSVDLLTCYKDFIQWGAAVIVNDMQLSTTDMFAAGLVNDGSVAYAAEQIAEAHPDVAFVSAAGNEAQDYFQAPYTPGPAASINGIAYPSLMDFGAAAGGASNTRLAVKFNYVSAFTPVLEWNDPVNTSPDSFVMALVDQTGRVLAAGTPFTTTNGRPGVSLAYEPASASQPAYVEIACKTCTNPVTLKLNGLADGSATFGVNLGGSVGYGQAVIPDGLTAGVAKVTQDNPLSVISEFFTGPGPFLYGDFGATGTETKPDLSGLDSVTVSGAGGFDAGSPATGGGVNFLGTSAAVPNVAGLLADIMGGNSGLSASTVYAALRNTADQRAFPAPGAASAFDPAQAGAGLVQGVGAWNALSSRTIPYVTAVDPPSAMPGSAFKVSVSGAGFMSGATVDFNATALPTTFVSSTLLAAQVPATLAGVPGVSDLVVTNPDPANTVSNTVSYLVGNPVPAISSWTPQKVVAGSGAFTLTVNGTNFMTGSTIMFDHSALATSVVSATQLTATIPASAVAQAGTYSLTVVNPGSTGTSSGVNFSVQAPSPEPASPAKSSGGGGGGVVLLLFLLGLVYRRVLVRPNSLVAAGTDWRCVR